MEERGREVEHETRYGAAPMKPWFIVAVVLLIAGWALPTVVSATPPQRAKTASEQAIDWCRLQSAVRLKHSTTVEWEDSAKEEKGNTFLVAGIRTAKGPSGNVDQQFTCRVQMVDGKPQLRMIQLFKESTQSERDLFQLFPEK